MSTPTTHKYRSFTITQGVERAPNRSMLRGIGYQDEDFKKPFIGLANGHSTLNPCNAGIQPLADAADKAIREAGGMPQMFGTITVTDGISMGIEGMKYCLPIAIHGRRARHRRLRQEPAGRDDRRLAHAMVTANSSTQAPPSPQMPENARQC